MPDITFKEIIQLIPYKIRIKPNMQIIYINFSNLFVLRSLFTDFINKKPKISDPGDMLTEELILPLPPS